MRIQQLHRVVAYLTCGNTAYHMTLLYANWIYVRGERHTMILVSWIETFIFIRGVIIQMMPMKWCDNIFEFWQINHANKIFKITQFYLSMRIKDEIFYFAHFWWCHNGWTSTTQNIAFIMSPLKMGKTKYRIFYSLNQSLKFEGQKQFKFDFE